VGKKKKLPYLPFYPADWLLAEKVLRLSREHRSYYLDLLCHMWLRSDDGCLFPCDPRSLAGIWGCTLDDAVDILDALQKGPMFKIVSRHGIEYLSHSRLTSELREIRAKSRERSESGRKGAAQTHKNRVGSASGSANVKSELSLGILELELESELEVDQTPCSTGWKRSESGVSHADIETVRTYFEDKTGREPSPTEKAFITRAVKQYGADEVKVQLGFAIETRAASIPGYAMAGLKESR
jgi:uncharacterized protein YdaU (DUF1376 family)